MFRSKSPPEIKKYASKALECRKRMDKSKNKIITRICENDRKRWIKGNKICLYRQNSMFCRHNSLFLFADTDPGPDAGHRKCDGLFVGGEFFR